MTNKLPTALLDAPEVSLEALAVLHAAELVKLADDPSVVVELADFAKDTQALVAKRSAMLKQPIRVLMAANEDNGPIPAGLADLKAKMEELDPKKFDFEPGWKSRVVSWIPGVGTPLQRYFAQYEAADEVIDAIIRSLNLSKDQMIRDNKTLSDDRVVTKQVIDMLDRRVKFGKLLDAELLKHVATADANAEKFIQEQLRFKLGQRLVDMGQQLAVGLQMVMAIDAVVANNKELIDGVDRASTVSVSALQTAVIVAIALANQKIALKKIQGLTATTAAMIEGTSERLKTQGVEIHKQAASALLPMESLKKAFDNTFEALDNIATFRREALPQFATTILALDAMTGDAQARLKLIEGGQKAAAAMVAAPAMVATQATTVAEITDNSAA